MCAQFSFYFSLLLALIIVLSEALPNLGTFSSFTDSEDVEEWEKSGLFEGDIALPDGTNRNAIVQSTKLWTFPIPVFIEYSEFDAIERQTIYNAMREIEKFTCVEFRKYKEFDKNFISVRGQPTGCWSIVGKRTGGQILNLHPPKCVTRGIVLHEFLHALGLYHQQGSSDRDNYVKINWHNIIRGKEDNFLKYPSTAVTSFNLTYDYDSIMHYSAKAFSKNGQPTITSLVANVTFGQRKQMSKKDVLKINHIYNCDSENDSDYTVEYLLGK